MHRRSSRPPDFLLHNVEWWCFATRLSAIVLSLICQIRGPLTLIQLPDPVFPTSIRKPCFIGASVMPMIAPDACELGLPGFSLLRLALMQWLLAPGGNGACTLFRPVSGRPDVGTPVRHEGRPCG